MKFSSFMNSKKNSCRGNYMRKYGILNEGVAKGDTSDPHDFMRQCDMMP